MTHIIFFKLKEATKENQQKLDDILSKMKGNIDYVESLEVGQDFVRDDRSYDVALIVKLPKDKLDDYANNELHCACKKEFAPLVDHTKSVDFE